MTLQSQVFMDLPYPYWKIQYFAYSKNISGSASIIFKVNQAPISGNCYIKPISGYAQDTEFIISCSDWVDPDNDTITKYEYYCIYLY